MEFINSSAKLIDPSDLPRYFEDGDEYMSTLFDIKYLTIPLLLDDKMQSEEGTMLHIFNYFSEPSNHYKSNWEDEVNGKNIKRTRYVTTHQGCIPKIADELGIEPFEIEKFFTQKFHKHPSVYILDVRGSLDMFALFSSIIPGLCIYPHEVDIDTYIIPGELKVEDIPLWCDSIEKINNIINTVADINEEVAKELCCSNNLNTGLIRLFLDDFKDLSMMNILNVLSGMYQAGRDIINIINSSYDDVFIRNSSIMS